MRGVLKCFLHCVGAMGALCILVFPFSLSCKHLDNPHRRQNDKHHNENVRGGNAIPAFFEHAKCFGCND